MCGIIGAITDKRITQDEIYKMCDTITHRGPNDRGFYNDSMETNLKKQLFFAQCRLSIMDLSDAGHQPMVAHDGQVVIVYNGEIYNFKEIRNTLIDKGYQFKSDCDTEVILNAYKEYGIEVVNQFNGMFAFALYDKKEELIYLVRDRLGVKPLYYFFDGSHFAFASELKPMMNLPFFKKEIDLGALGQYFAYKYIPTPKTIFKNTFKLEQGTILKYQNNKIKKIVYWSLNDKFNNRTLIDLEFDQCKKRLETLIEDAVAKRMLSDVPVGTFLSGGIDSTLITALAQKNRRKPVNTFTIGFKEKQYDESIYAKEIAKLLGTNHHEEFCSVEDAKEFIFEVPKYFDEPFADSSQLPMLMVSKMAKKKITVALSGDAGDELFCGYKNYEDILIQKKYLILGKTFSNIYNLHTSGNRLLWKIGKIIKPKTEDNILHSDPMNTADITNKLFKTSLNKQIITEHVEALNTTGNIQEKKMVLDMVTYLPDDILVKVDRATMRYSVEARCPLLDYRVVEESFCIPHHFKYNEGNKKYILKEILYQYVPKELMDRPKKGFSIPIHQWLKNDLRPLLENLIDIRYLEKQNIFDVRAVEKLYSLFKKYENRVLTDIMWCMFMFQLWYKEYIEKDV